jgi:hypothetical protein
MTTLIQWVNGATRVVRGKQAADMPTVLSVAQRSISGAAAAVDLTNIDDVATAVQQASSYSGSVPDVTATGAVLPLALTASPAGATWNTTTGACNTPSVPVSEPNLAITLRDRDDNYILSGTYSRTGQIYIRPQTMQSGSLGAHMDGRVAALMDGQTYNDSKRTVWSSNNYSTSAWSGTRNASNVLAGVNMTCMSAAQRFSGVDEDNYPWMLISPRHALAATHVISGRERAVWVGADGNPYYANVTSSSDLGGTLTDLTLLYLSADISSQVTPVSILPANYLTYLPFITRTDFRRAGVASIPAIRVFMRLLKTTGADVERYAWSGLGSNVNGKTSRIEDLAYTNSANYDVDTGRNLGLGALEQAANWPDFPTAGDSGSPVFTQVNGTTVLLFQLFTTTTGPELSGNASFLNTQMRALAAAQGDNFPYAMREVDLSGFNSYA